MRPRLLGIVLGACLFHVRVAAQKPGGKLWEFTTTGSVRGPAAFADDQVCLLRVRVQSPRATYVAGANGPTPGPAALCGNRHSGPNSLSSSTCAITVNVMWSQPAHDLASARKQVKPNTSAKYNDASRPTLGARGRGSKGTNTLQQCVCGAPGLYRKQQVHLRPGPEKRRREVEIWAEQGCGLWQDNMPFKKKSNGAKL